MVVIGVSVFIMFRIRVRVWTFILRRRPLSICYRNTWVHTFPFIASLFLSMATWYASFLALSLNISCCNFWTRKNNNNIFLTLWSANALHHTMKIGKLSHCQRTILLELHIGYPHTISFLFPSVPTLSNKLPAFLRNNTSLEVDFTLIYWTTLNQINLNMAPFSV